MTTLNEALRRYEARCGHRLAPAAVLFDMDGVLYDSMPLHARAWKMLADDLGIKADENEFFAYEGRTGASTINILFNRGYGHGADEDTCRRLYAIKSRYFKEMTPPEVMPGAKAAVGECMKRGAATVLVTGSAQASNLERLGREFPGAFAGRVTGNDVRRGKPDPEPFLMGMAKAGVEPWQAVAIDNAPLGVESASGAGAFTIGVRTGPLPEGALRAAGADIEINSMAECAEILAQLL